MHLSESTSLQTHPIDRAQALLSAAGLRAGRVRLALLAELIANPDACWTIPALIERLSVRPQPNRSTLYRELDALTAAGLIEQLSIVPGTISIKARCCSESHHHLVCDTCHRSAVINEPELNEAIAHIAQTAASLGFNVPDQHLLLRGTCPECRLR
jgi:Fe2+ or Zn2+ uptake regulation protein